MEKTFHRAAQIWPILVLCATRRETLSYGLLGQLIGVPAQGLAKLLAPIQWYCLGKRLPGLTSLVVRAKTGVPGPGYVASRNVPREQARVYLKEWLLVPPPQADAFASLRSSKTQRAAQKGRKAKGRREN